MAAPVEAGANSPALPAFDGAATPQSVHNKAEPSNGAIHNKLLDAVIRTPDRLPSPQPTNLGGTHLRKLPHEEGTGYVAPKFEGKGQQMEQGKQNHLIYAD